jgi:Raf kinase inhibitor-like YbhB/YbcL family protein
MPLPTVRFERALIAVLLIVSFAACSDSPAPAHDDDNATENELDASAGSRKDARAEEEDEEPPAPPIDASTASRDPSAASSDAASPVPDAAPAAADASAARAFTLSSEIYKDGEAIPMSYRCQSPSPAVSWTAGPTATGSYALTLIDVTTGPSRGVVHWLIYDVPATRFELPMAVPSGAAPASVAPIKQGPNYLNARAYQGPCGGSNTYELTLYALDVESLPMLTASSSSAQVLAAIQAHDLANSKLEVTSSR